LTASRRVLDTSSLRHSRDSRLPSPSRRPRSWVATSRSVLPNRVSTSPTHTQVAPADSTQQRIAQSRAATSPTGLARAHSPSCHKAAVSLRVASSAAASTMRATPAVSAAAVDVAVVALASPRATESRGTSATGSARVRCHLHQAPAHQCAMAAG